MSEEDNQSMWTVIPSILIAFILDLFLFIGLGCTLKYIYNLYAHQTNLSVSMFTLLVIGIWVSICFFALTVKEILSTVGPSVVTKLLVLATACAFAWLIGGLISL